MPPGVAKSGRELERPCLTPRTKSKAAMRSNIAALIIPVEPGLADGDIRPPGLATY